MPKMTECKDVTFLSNLESLLETLSKRYGTGYDRIKTISIISEGIKRDLKELDEYREDDQ